MILEYVQFMLNLFRDESSDSDGTIRGSYEVRTLVQRIHTYIMCTVDSVQTYNYILIRVLLMYIDLTFKYKLMLTPHLLSQTFVNSPFDKHTDRLTDKQTNRQTVNNPEPCADNKLKTMTVQWPPGVINWYFFVFYLFII